MRKRSLSFICALSLLGGAVLVLAQGGAPQPKASGQETAPFGHAEMQVGVGSFRLQRNGRSTGEGRADLTFRGTVLLSQYQGKPVIISGNVRKEYEGYGRVVYFGQGRIIIDGKFRAFQWFGGDMKCTFDGNAAMQFSGEYGGPTTGGGYLKIDEAPPRLWYSSGMNCLIPALVLDGSAPRPSKGIDPKSAL